MTDVIKSIKQIAENIYKSIKKSEQPSVSSPLRSLQNVRYDSKDGYFELNGKMKERTMTVSSVKTFAQTLRMMALSKQLIKSDDIATKREAYYVSKNWGDARFREQPESDSVMDDVEAMLMVNREQIRFIPEEKGGDVAGKLVVVDKSPDTGKQIKIDCTKMGSGAYSIPSSVEELKFETDAKFILAIETAGMFQRLVKHNFWKNHNCILISLGGVPTRACRRFIRRLSDDKNLPVYVFTDGDPYGYANIYRTLKVGSGNAAHINQYFCVPK
ncbi:MAG: DNA topoisomerase VI, partial [Candidatus Woesearchaeota archaeon]